MSAGLPSPLLKLSYAALTSRFDSFLKNLTIIMIMSLNNFETGVTLKRTTRTKYHVTKTNFFNSNLHNGGFRRSLDMMVRVKGTLIFLTGGSLPLSLFSTIILWPDKTDTPSHFYNHKIIYWVIIHHSQLSLTEHGNLQITVIKYYGELWQGFLLQLLLHSTDIKPNYITVQYLYIYSYMN